MISQIRHRLRALFQRDAVESELDDELRFHLDQATEAYVRDGHPVEEARRRARIDLGGVEVVKEECRDEHGVSLLRDLGADVRYGVRVLRRSPAFSIVAILTLALGIGSNIAMFAVVDDVLLNPLPYEAPDRLVRLHASKPAFPRGSISYPNFVDWQASNRSFEAIAVSRRGAFTLTGAGAAERIAADLVSRDYFSVLRIEPLLGRAFVTDEAVALLGENVWRRKFAASPTVIGTTVQLDGKGYVVVGVMPARTDLRAVSGGQPADVYIPITQRDQEALKQRAAGLGIHGIGRLKPGVSLAQARADMAAVTSGLAATYPETNKSIGATILPLEDSVVGNLRPYLLVLFAAVGLVLLIACVNVANLLLARATVRSHELAIRVAVGASFGRLIRQLLTESLLLAVAGGAFGLLIAWWSTDVLLALLPGPLSRVDVDSFDPRVMIFTGAVSIFAGVLAGLVPALKAIRPNLYDTLKEGGRSYSARSRPQAVFVVMQTALAVVLLVGAGLLVRTMVQLSRIDPGYEPSGIVTFGLSLAPTAQTAPAETLRGALHDIHTSLATTPGVEASAFSLGSVPVEGGDQSLFWIDGRPQPATQDQMSWTVTSIVSPDYLTAMKIPLVRGRFFTTRDNQHAPSVVVIDEVFARMHFPGEDPIGKRVRLADFDFEPVEIVGIVGHVKMFGLDQDDSASVRAQLYMSFLQLPDPLVARAAAGVFVLARMRGEQGAVTSLRNAIERSGSGNVMYRVRSGDEIIGMYQATRRFAMYMLAAFAALALLLCSIGIYGVIAYIVARRTTEIGIRMALGATAGNIMRLVLRDGLTLALAGIAIGLVVACGVTRFMAGMLFGVSPIDPLTFAVVAVAVTLVSLIALVIPARRAMRLDVMRALRTE